MKKTIASARKLLPGDLARARGRVIVWASLRGDDSQFTCFLNKGDTCLIIAVSNEQEDSAFKVNNVLVLAYGTYGWVERKWLEKL